MILLNGQIISSNKNNIKNDIIEFDQLNIDLKKLSNRTIKVPKIQKPLQLNWYHANIIIYFKIQNAQQILKMN